MIQLPRFISLDSSTWGQLSKDFYSGNSEKSEQAVALVEALNELVIIPAVAFDHVAELLQHENSDVVNNRLKFFRLLDQIGWIRSSLNSPLPGSFIDVDTFEVQAVGSGLKSVESVRGLVRESIWNYGRGVDLFFDNDIFWDGIRRFNEGRREQATEIVSLMRANPENMSTRTLGTFIAGEITPNDEFEKRLRWKEGAMLKSIVKHGAKDLLSPASTVAGFYDELRPVLQTLNGSPTERIIQITDHFNIPREIVHLQMTLAELGDLAHFSGNLTILNRRLQPKEPFSLQTISPNSCPSFSLRRELRACQHKEQRVTGSNLNDVTLAAISIYADFTQVDKRTNEYVGQIRGKHQIGKLCNRVFCCSHYSKIINYLTE